MAGAGSADSIPWWGWLLLWTVLVLAAVVVLGALGYRLVRRGLVAVAEAGAAGTRASELLSRVEVLPPLPRVPPAVFDDPARLRRERSERLARERRARKGVVVARRQAVRRAAEALVAAPVAGTGRPGQPSARRAAPNT